MCSVGFATMDGMDDKQKTKSAGNIPLGFQGIPPSAPRSSKQYIRNLQHGPQGDNTMANSAYNRTSRPIRPGDLPGGSGVFWGIPGNTCVCVVCPSLIWG